MTAFETRSRVGPDAKLHVAVPPSFVNRDVRVIIETERPANGAARTPQEREDSLRRIAGSIDDPTFERPPQGEFDEREPLD